MANYIIAYDLDTTGPKYQETSDLLNELLENKLKAQRFQKTVWGLKNGLSARTSPNTY